MTAVSNLAVFTNPSRCGNCKKMAEVLFHSLSCHSSHWCKVIALRGKTPSNIVHGLFVSGMLRRNMQGDYSRGYYVVGKQGGNHAGITLLGG